MALRNLLPFGVTRNLQVELSTLLDAYKQAEALPEHTAAVYTMSSILTDQAEPSEALRATVVWSTGLENPKILLSEDQVKDFLQRSRADDRNLQQGQAWCIFCTVLVCGSRRKGKKLAHAGRCQPGAL